MMHNIFLYPFFVLLLSLAPWKAAYYDALTELRVIVHEYPCDSAAWTGPDRAIHLCPAPGDNWGWLGLHESQHIMAGTYLPPMEWDIFASQAMKGLREGNYTAEQIATAEYILSYGGHELHAELPWITHGDIPPNLQRWYPWFDLGD